MYNADSLLLTLIEESEAPMPPRHATPASKGSSCKGRMSSWDLLPLTQRARHASDNGRDSHCHLASGGTEQGRYGHRAGLRDPQPRDV